MPEARACREDLICLIRILCSLGDSSKLREAEEGRHISTERFIEIYFQAREVVNALKAEFGRMPRRYPF